jgi:ubiquitin carboxyl-terminal hydrolase 7
MLTII